MTTDVVTEGESLEQRFATGGQPLLRAAYEQHGSLVHSFCSRMVGPADAADVTQEVFVSAWRAQERYDPARGSLPAFLIGIAKNRCIDHLRRRNRQPRTVDLGAEDATLVRSLAERAHGAEGGSGAGAEADIDRVAQRMLLAEALDSLPERQRTVIVLAFVEDLTHEQIAQRCNVPLGTVKSDLRRNLPRLARALQGLTVGEL
ncbi:MAG: RNA polymerase sigma factor [Acidimicrobiales bacterium]